MYGRETWSLSAMYEYKLQVSGNSVNHLIFVMVKCDVLFEVRTEFLNII
jgi:uncharacterized protein (DUF486 family)